MVVIEWLHEPFDPPTQNTINILYSILIRNKLQQIVKVISTKRHPRPQVYVQLHICTCYKMII